MVSLYALDLNAFDWQACLPSLPTERRARVLSCRDPDDSRRIAGAGYLLSLALERAGVSRTEQVFARTDLGKPYLENRPDLHFSLSHAGPWAVCAVGFASGRGRGGPAVYHGRGTAVFPPAGGRDPRIPPPGGAGPEFMSPLDGKGGLWKGLGDRSHRPPARFFPGPGGSGSAALWILFL